MNYKAKEEHEKKRELGQQQFGLHNGHYGSWFENQSANGV